MTDPTKCARQPACNKRVSALSPWHPFCSNECEQLAQAAAQRAMPAANTGGRTANARQMDLDTAKEWQPQVFPVGSLGRAIHTLMEDNIGVRYTREELRSAQSMVSTGPGIKRVPEREVTETIRELRRAGWPICSSSGEAGYWLSWEPEDLNQLEQTLRGRSLDMLRTLAAVRRARMRVGRVPILDEMIDQFEHGEV